MLYDGVVKLGIHQKLVLTYAGIGAAVALLSAVAVVSLHRRMTQLGDFKSPDLYAVQDLQSLYFSAVEEGFAYLASGDVGERDQFELKLAELGARLEAFEATRIQPGELEERRLHDAIAAGRQALLDGARELFRQYETTGSIRRDAFDDYERTVDSLARDLHALAEIQKQEIAEVRLSANDALRLSMRLIWGVGIAAIVVSALVAHLVGRRIVRPIHALQAGVMRLGDGAAPITVPADGEDELGDVARAFNEMARRVHAGRAELEAQVVERTAKIQQSSHELEASLAALREAQASLVVSERLAAVGLLAAGVAHEINNPLSYIVANLAYLRDGLSLEQRADSPERLQAIDEALQGADKVRAIVLDLKTFARGADELKGPVDLNDVVASTLAMAANQLRHRATLVTDLAPACSAHANEGRLTQVLLNLVVNALQALPERVQEQNRISIATRSRPGAIEIEVADNGCGIAAEHLDRIWEPFFTTKPVGVGTGLGLPICRRIVESFGGSIAVESCPGKGSRFRIVLPEATRALPESTSPAPELRV